MFSWNCFARTRRLALVLMIPAPSAAREIHAAPKDFQRVGRAKIHMGGDGVAAQTALVQGASIGGRGGLRESVFREGFRVADDIGGFDMAHAAGGEAVEDGAERITVIGRRGDRENTVAHRALGYRIPEHGAGHHPADGVSDAASIKADGQRRGTQRTGNAGADVGERHARQVESDIARLGNAIGLDLACAFDGRLGAGADALARKLRRE